MPRCRLSGYGAYRRSRPISCVPNSPINSAADHRRSHSHDRTRRHPHSLAPLLRHLDVQGTHVHAIEPVLLRASLARPGPVLVGERMTITVELLTVTTFAS